MHYLIWFAAILVFLIVEAATTQLVTIWFALGALCAFFVSLAGALEWIQWTVFLGVSILSLLATRPLVKKFMNKKIQPTNADRCIGQDAVVTEAIDNVSGKGLAMIKGAVWSARSKDGSHIETGVIVRVEEIQGVKLIVTKKENAEGEE